MIKLRPDIQSAILHLIHFPDLITQPLFGYTDTQVILFYSNTFTAFPFTIFN